MMRVVLRVFSLLLGEKEVIWVDLGDFGLNLPLPRVMLRDVNTAIPAIFGIIPNSGDGV
jgi:hypothetical protein